MARPKKKKVIYLFGAGATQAVVKAINPEKGLLTADIQDVIEKQFSSKGVDDRIWNELITKGNDIEHLISVLESQHNYAASEKLREHYRDAIVKLSEEISDNPPSNLYSILIDLHRNIKKLDEELSCFITLNYEDILERTIKAHFKYEIDYTIQTLKMKKIKRTSIKVFKLHGSFNWFNSRPIAVKKMASLQSKDTLWIPPGVEKRKENYPFNLLWGKAIEQLMNCDVLRIVGCSLSRNDWGLIPILYTVQRFNENGSGMEIQVIDYPETADSIKKMYKYLNVKSLTELPEFFSFYKKQFQNAQNDSEVINEIEAKFIEKEKVNPLQEWLDAKIDYAFNVLHADLTSAQNYVYNFYHKAYG